jgi:hypothetical protein
MSSSYESIGRTLQDAAARIPVPPQSRWVPDVRRRSSAGHTFATIAAATLVVMLGAAVIAFRPGIVPAAQADRFLSEDAAAWAQVRINVPPDGLVLRPTWLPIEYRADSPECPSPMASTQEASGTFSVRYSAGFIYAPQRAPKAECTRIEIKTLTVSPEASFYGVGLVDVAPIDARGTTVRVRIGSEFHDASGRAYNLIYFNWWEAGVSYELNTYGANMNDLILVLRDLKPMK